MMTIMTRLYILTGCKHSFTLTHTTKRIGMKVE